MHVKGSVIAALREVGALRRAPPFTFALVSGESIEMAANGDELRLLLVSGTVVFANDPTNPGPPGLVITTSLTQEIVGGTGRFAGATGLVHLVAVSTPDNRNPTAEIVGTISSVGSK